MDCACKNLFKTLELAEGSKVNVDNLIREIEMLSYIADTKADSPGQFFK